MFAGMRALAVRTRAWLLGRDADEDFEDEIEGHLDLLTADNLRRGMAPEEARRNARLQLGGVTQLKETNRELRGLPLIETFLQDIRYAFRMFRKNPGFTAVALFTLALAIGANTATFSVVYAVLLKPLPYAHADQLFNVFQEKSQDESAKTFWSYPNFENLRGQSSSFSEMAGSQQHQLTLTSRGEPSLVDTSVVTPGFFSLFGEKPLAGRIFFRDDGKPGAAPVVILSEDLWRGRFGADPTVIGSSISLDQRSFTVVGIMPSRFRFPRITRSEQLWIPLAQDPLFGGWTGKRAGHWLQVTGRLKPGVTTAQARAELNAIGTRLAEEFPAENSGWVARMAPLQDLIVGDVRSVLLVLLSVVGLVLLIACANIANLLLSRATTRAQEIAVRTALGAGRARTIRQLLSESMALGLTGGAMGVALAYLGLEGLIYLLPATLPRVNAIRVDHVVLLFALVLSVVASCAFGLAPALIVANSGLQTSLREGSGRSGESRRTGRLRRFLAAGEIALAMVLLVTAGLLLRSFSKLTSVNPGFNVQRIIKANISLPRFQYSTPQQWIAFSDRLLAAIQAEPGLKDTAAVVPAPLADGPVTLKFDIAGSPPLSESASRTAHYVAISPAYFHTMEIPLLAGRVFDRSDVLTAPRVSIISKAMARTYFPNQNPIGKRLIFSFPPDPGVAREIVGIVGDVRDVGLGDDPGPMMYVPYDQAPFAGTDLVVRSTLSEAAVAAAIRRDVGKIDKDLAVSAVVTMPDVLDTSVAQPRFRAFFVALFAAIALVLAATGIFGVISYSVSCRTREIGIRMAVGASRNAILWMVTRETLVLTLAGLAAGALCAFAASHLVGRMLFGIPAYDPVTLSVVAVVLFVVASLAGYVPARRAMQVEAMVALRHQ